MTNSMDTQWEGTMEEWAANGYQAPDAPAVAPTEPAAPPSASDLTETDVHALSVRGPGMRIEAPAPVEAPTVRFEAPNADAARYIGVLERRVNEGTARAAIVIRKAATVIPRDQIAPAYAVKWEPSENLRRGIEARVDGLVLTPTDHALAQIAERAGVPGPYLRDLVGIQTAKTPAEALAAQTWKRELAAKILTEHYAHARSRVLVRSVDGELRGWLSDSYRRIDSRPLVEALIQEAQAVGAIPYDGSATETRVAIKVILPRVIEVMPGEYMVLGAEWSNSDYGNGIHGVRTFGLRVVCLNGMTTENLLKQVHLGRKLSEDVAMSARTLELDTQTNVSALRDVVRAAFGPARVETLGDEIRAAAAREYTGSQLAARLKNFPKSTVKAAVDAYRSEDVTNLPPGENAWRASNAVSWIARHEEDAERRLDLERAAGNVLERKPAKGDDAT